MRKRVKNNTASAKVWCGQTVAPGAYYELDLEEYKRWSKDPAVVAAITDGSAVINDGTADITNVADAVSFLQGTSVSFTEKMETLGTSSSSIWVSRAVPNGAGKLAHIIFRNGTNGTRTVGARSVGSSIDRTILMGAGSSVSFYVNVNDDGNIETYTDHTGVSINLVGWVD